MKAPSQLIIVKHLVHDTFRQARASGISTMMLVITALSTVLCLSARISGDVSLHDGREKVYFLPSSSSKTSMVGSPHGPETLAERARREGIETVGGQMTLAFGAVAIPLGRERADAVHLIELLLGGGVAGTAGVLLALVWTSGFVPAFLEPRTASVLLTKPIRRWELLMGKYLGVLIFVGFQATLFVVCTWLALGVRTRVWDATYLWTIPLLLVQFATYYSFSMFLAVVVRSTVASIFGSVLYWLLAWGINYGRVMAGAIHAHRALSPLTRMLVEGAYWLFPKPIDSGLILFNTVDAQQHFEKPVTFVLLESGRAFSPQLSLLSSLALTVGLLILSAYELDSIDY